MYPVNLRSSRYKPFGDPVIVLASILGLSFASDETLVMTITGLAFGVYHGMRLGLYISYSKHTSKSTERQQWKYDACMCVGGFVYASFFGLFMLFRICS